MGEKFKEFYFTGDQRLHNLDELEKEYEQKSGDISSYRGRIFCPECRIAELAFTHKKSKRRAFLSCFEIKYQFYQLVIYLINVHFAEKKRTQDELIPVFLK